MRDLPRAVRRRRGARSTNSEYFDELAGRSDPEIVRAVARSRASGGRRGAGTPGAALSGAGRRRLDRAAACAGGRAPSGRASAARDRVGRRALRGRDGAAGGRPRRLRRDRLGRGRDSREARSGGLSARARAARRASRPTPWRSRTLLRGSQLRRPPACAAWPCSGPPRASGWARPTRSHPGSTPASSTGCSPAS